MMCFKHFAIYAVLLPVPSASPVLLATFAVALFLAVRPCGYCMTLLLLLFVTTSPSSPFLSAPPPPAAPADAGAAHPVPGRTWLATNGGRLFDPALVGFRKPRSDASASDCGGGAAAESDADGEGDGSAADLVDVDTALLGHWPGIWKLGMSASPRGIGAPPRGHPLAVDPDAQAALEQPLPEALGSSTAAALPSPSPAADLPPPSPAAAAPPDPPLPAAPLPPSHVDARFRGLGFVLDLGWRRSDGGVEWELAHGGRATAATAATSAGDAPPGADESAARRERPAPAWGGVSFLGSW